MGRLGTIKSGQISVSSTFMSHQDGSYCGVLRLRNSRTHLISPSRLECIEVAPLGEA